MLEEEKNEKLEYDGPPLSSQPHPWLVICPGRKTQTFYSISEGRSYKRHNLRNTLIRASAREWLVLEDFDYTDCYLFNPISNDKIELPLIPYNNKLECLLSAPPNDPECRVLFLIHETTPPNDDDDDDITDDENSNDDTDTNDDDTDNENPDDDDDTDHENPDDDDDTEHENPDDDDDMEHENPDDDDDTDHENPDDDDDTDNENPDDGNDDMDPDDDDTDSNDVDTDTDDDDDTDNDNPDDDANTNDDETDNENSDDDDANDDNPDDDDIDNENPNDDANDNNPDDDENRAALYFCKPGYDEEFHKQDMKSLIGDDKFLAWTVFKGDFYVLTWQTSILLRLDVDDSSGTISATPMTNQPPFDRFIEYHDMPRSANHLIQSSSHNNDDEVEMLFVRKLYYGREFEDVYAIIVCRFNFVKKEWEEMKSIGETAIFLSPCFGGTTCSTRDTNLKKESIYFTHRSISVSLPCPHISMTKPYSYWLTLNGP